jgi:hypothetical protein
MSVSHGQEFSRSWLRVPHVNRKFPDLGSSGCRLPQASTISDTSHTVNLSLGGAVTRWFHAASASKITRFHEGPCTCVEGRDCNHDVTTDFRGIRAGLLNRFGHTRKLPPAHDTARFCNFRWRLKWSEWRDSNPRPLVPQRGV